ncbi:flagellin FlaB [Halorientalis persicus]|uniref:Flagellin n=1 Tax=Halorientalis persicus TaxID=1367881 RepID=A0A1H8NUX3_9EURY|nr:archaellin/type IV pilin N-terminal domain-containing protein [Halorientalis persicus]SEO33148.1 flagellin FlaB [Halorientalis persicus]
MFEIFKEDEDRGQVGIGTLIVFIAMVLVAAIAAGVLINTAGFLQSQSEETGQQSSQQVTNRLAVQQSSGLVEEITGDKLVVGGVEMIATKAPGAEDIDLTGVTMQWVDDSGTYDLVHENVANSDDNNNNPDGTFSHVAIKDQDSSLSGDAPVINSPDDRAKIIISVGDIYSEDPAFPTNAIPINGGDGLEEGDTATIRITTQSGSVSTVRLTVPESLSGKSAATL